MLTVKLHHRFSGKVYLLGRFRLSVTRQPRPVGLGLPEDFRAVLATAPEVRTEAQKNLLLAYFRVMDPELRQKTDAVTASKAPLPVDPAARRAARASSSRPSARSRSTRCWSSSATTWR